MDHFFQLPQLGRPDEPMFECYTLLAALAARTSPVRLGTMVGGVTYRNPALLAKQVTALDVISGGPGHLGHRRRLVRARAQRPSATTSARSRERFEKLEEALQIVKSMFVNDVTTFEGRWYQVRDAYNVPKPVPAGRPAGAHRRQRRAQDAAAGRPVRRRLQHLRRAPQVQRLMGVLDGTAPAGPRPVRGHRTRLGTLVLGRTHDEADARRGAMLASRGVDWAALPERRAADIRPGRPWATPTRSASRSSALLDAGLDGTIWNLPDAHDLDSLRRAGEVLGKTLR